MAMAWQRNLATTTSNLENYNNNSNKKKNCITQDTHTYKNNNLSLRYERVLLFIIIWICKTRLQLRRSDRVSQPNSS